MLLLVLCASASFAPILFARSRSALPVQAAANVHPNTVARIHKQRVAEMTHALFVGRFRLAAKDRADQSGGALALFNVVACGRRTFARVQSTKGWMCLAVTFAQCGRLRSGTHVDT